MAARQTHTQKQREELVRKARELRAEGRSWHSIAAALGLSRRSCYRLRQHPLWEDPVEMPKCDADARFPTSQLWYLQDCVRLLELPAPWMAWLYSRSDRTIRRWVSQSKSRARMPDTSENGQ